MVDSIAQTGELRRNRRLQAVLVVLAVAFASLAVPLAERADSVWCGTDAWADWDYWDDNYHVAYQCDQHGRYTVGIQRINWHHGYRNSTVDGYFGTNTYNDIKNFQQAHGVTSDGWVGGSTWTQYRNHLTYTSQNGGFDYYTYTTAPYYIDFALDVVDNPEHWYTLWVGWSRFDKYGP